MDGSIAVRHRGRGAKFAESEIGWLEGPWWRSSRRGQNVASRVRDTEDGWTSGDPARKKQCRGQREGQAHSLSGGEMAR